MTSVLKSKSKLFWKYARYKLKTNQTIQTLVKQDGDITSTDEEKADTFFNGSYPIPTGLMQMNGSSDYIEVFFQGEEDVSLHDASDIKSHFFAQLVHAT